MPDKIYAVGYNALHEGVNYPGCITVSAKKITSTDDVRAIKNKVINECRSSFPYPDRITITSMSVVGEWDN